MCCNEEPKPSRSVPVMSLPIDIPRRARPSALSSQLSSSSSSSSLASSRSSLLTTPSPSPSSSKGLYIPIHKRTPSADPHYPNEDPAPHTHTYTIDTLLSLRPNADESIRDKLRASGHPELILSRRIRKNLEFHDRQRLSTPHHDDNNTSHTTATTATAIDAGIHRVPTFPLPPKPLHVPSFITQQQQQQRALPRRNTSAGRTSRRHQAWQPISIAASTGTWRGLSLRQSQIV